ncbi:MAG: alpha-1,2-fucosyltransferase [Patescibacteria group bacterium]
MKIITKIVGGLGNQMFQYAIGRSMAIKNNAELVLDTYDFKTYRRPYFLDRFNIQENYLPDDEAIKYRKYETRFSPSLVWENIKSIKNRTYRLEKPSEYFKFIPGFLDTDKNETVYLNGYWQNERYFKEIRNELLNEFTLKVDFNIENTDVFKRANTQKSVAIHFRRGEDQLSKPMYGVPPIQYYYDALNYINDSLGGGAHAIIFTNDPEWVKNNYKPDISHEFAIDSNLTDFQELSLMAACSNHIIANSTFSWWGAWLGQEVNKNVIAPKTWLSNNQYDTVGLYLSNWIRM